MITTAAILKKDLTLVIEGMTCGHCASTVQTALAGVEGVAKAKVDLSNERAWVRAERGLPKEELVRAVEDAGYRAIPL